MSGIYCVYECTHNRREGTVTIHKLIYIGESANVRSRIAGHEKRRDWLKHVRAGNELCYNFGSIVAQDRERGEAAYIYKHKPIENTEYVNDFPYPTTTCISEGKAFLLTPRFTVTKTVRSRYQIGW